MVSSTKIVYLPAFRDSIFLHPSFLPYLHALVLLSAIHEYFLWFLHCLSLYVKV
jgi:hypothetical protein